MRVEEMEQVKWLLYRQLILEPIVLLFRLPPEVSTRVQFLTIARSNAGEIMIMGSLAWETQRLVVLVPETWATVDLGASAIELSSGFQHSCARLVNGKVKCWGFNMFGQLGLGDTSARGDSSGEMGSALSYISLGSN